MLHVCIHTISRDLSNFWYRTLLLLFLLCLCRMLIIYICFGLVHAFATYGVMVMKVEKRQGFVVCTKMHSLISLCIYETEKNSGSANS